jgi:hypothetical protein
LFSPTTHGALEAVPEFLVDLCVVAEFLGRHCLLNPAGFVDIVFYEEPTAGRVDAGEC